MSRKPLKRGEETDLWPTEILVHIGDSRGQRILVSVRYGERQKIEVARKRDWNVARFTRKKPLLLLLSMAQLEFSLVRTLTHTEIVKGAVFVEA